MKRTLIVLAKITLFCLFLYNIGLFSLFSYYIKNIDWRGEPINRENQIKINRFLREKIKIAEDQGNKYSPDKYFSDLTEIREKEKELSGIFGYQNHITNLVHKMHVNICAGYFSNYQVEVAREKYEKHIDPIRPGREEVKKKIDEGTFWSDLGNLILLIFLPWFWAFYLKNFFLGLFYLCTRWEKEYNTFKIKNPFSFCIAVLLYPYVIGRLFVGWLKKSGKYLTLEANLRMRKEKFFSLLSENEVLKIRKFVKNNLSQKDWQLYLNGQGLVVRRSFAQALLATLLLSVFSATIFKLSAQTLSTGISTDYQIEVEAKTNDFPSFMDCQKIVKGAFDDACEIFIFLFELFEKNFSRVFTKLVFRFFILTRKIEHIPLVNNI